MAEAEGDHQISVEDEESPFSTKIDASKQIPAGRNVLRLVLLSFGLLCILQAALNVSLRLTSLSRSFSQHVATFCSDIYYISSTKKTWNESRKDCLERGSDLVIINSKAEQEYLRRLNKKFWIGLTDAEQEGEWKWVDGTQLQESYWGTGEPNSFEERNEDCGEIKYLGKKNNWNDEPCYLKNHWICERKL